MKIAVAGTGYVGLSLSVLLSQHNEVVAVDIVPEKVKKLNEWQSPIQDDYIEKYLAEHEERNLNLRATTDGNSAYASADYVIISAPTNYDPHKNFFDTSAVESVIEQVMDCSDTAMMVIKSTIPVGYTERVRKKFSTNRIIFSPEFLRESKALYDNLYPSRIIVGCDAETRDKAEKFAELLVQGAEKKDVEVLTMGLTEAEAVKLFANTYLALRVSYFNELDTYAEMKGLDTGDIIRGVSLDPRVGDFYNNPSFGYGGYCLPKDTKQLLVNYQEIPQNIISAVVTSNITRKEYIVSKLLQQKPHTVGVYRLIMKSQSDNFRDASIMDIMDNLKKQGINVVIYEPILTCKYYMDYEVVDSLEELNRKCDVIIANRITSEIKQYGTKVYTRDIFGEN